MTAFTLRAALAESVMASLVVGLDRPEQVDRILEALDGPPLSREMVHRAREPWRAGL